MWISLIKNLGIKRYRSLLKILKTNKNIYNAKEEDLNKCEGIGEKIIKQILDKNIKLIAKKTSGIYDEI